MVSADEEFRRK